MKLRMSVVLAVHGASAATYARTLCKQQPVLIYL